MIELVCECRNKTKVCHDKVVLENQRFRSLKYCFQQLIMKNIVLIESDETCDTLFTFIYLLNL